MSIQTSDPVADLITRIRNAIAVGRPKSAFQPAS